MKEVEKMRIILLIGAIVFLAIPQKILGATPNFRLDAKVVTAIEGGPFVVQVTLRYHGDTPVDIRMSNDEFEAFVKGPSEWKVNFFDDIQPRLAHIIHKRYQLNTGGSITRYLSVHGNYPEVPRGPAKIVVKWNVYDASKTAIHHDDEFLLSQLSKELDLNVAETTQHAIRDLSLSLCKKLDESPSSLDISRMALAHIKELPRKEFAMVAMKLLDRLERPSDQYKQMMYIDTLPLSELKKTDLLVNYLLLTSPRAFAVVFDYWRAHDFHPKKDVFNSIENAPNLWVRALAVASIGYHAEKRHRLAIAEAIQKRLEAEPSDEFVKLLTELDDPSYKLREQATRKLTQMGERVEGMIWRSISNSPSSEVEMRLIRVLKEIEQKEPFPESFRAIATLERLQTPEAKDILKVIAEGPGEVRSTREAKGAIERLKGTPTP